jgi:hypothetical protein
MHGDSPRYWSFFPLAMLQAVASFALLVVSGEVETIAVHAIGSRVQAPAPLQVHSFFLLVALAALPLGISVYGISRRTARDRMLMLLFAAFLVVVLVASAQTFGAWRLWLDHQLPTATPN